MTETQTMYTKKTTFTKLAKYIFGFCHHKIMRDIDKIDPLTETFEDLKKMGEQEKSEKLKALRIWESSHTDRNAVAVLNEIADEINILLFQAGKVANYTEMERK